MAVSREDLSKLRQKFENDFNLLQDKLENMTKVTKIVHESNKALKERVADLEEKMNNSVNVSSNEDDKRNIDEEISKLRDEKIRNMNEIKEIEERLVHLENE